MRLEREARDSVARAQVRCVRAVSVGRVDGSIATIIGSCLFP